MASFRNNQENQRTVRQNRNRLPKINRSYGLTEKIVALDIDGKSVNPSADGAGVETVNKKVRAIPYYSWCNRGGSQMQVWLPFRIETIIVNSEEPVL